MTKLQQQISDQFPDLHYEFDYPLAKMSFFKIGGNAEVYLNIMEMDELTKVIEFCKSNDVKYTVLGGASNVVISDDGVEGVVIHLSNSGFKIIDNDIDGFTKVEVGAGIKMSVLVKEMMDVGLTGLEYFLGVPGTLGGAIYNNAHYLSDLIGEHVDMVGVIDKNGKKLVLTQEECEFGYDKSRFQDTKEVIFSVLFSLKRGTQHESTQLIKEATQYRASTQPLGIPSSGCIFQNVPNTEELKVRFPQFVDKTHISGGFLIDQAGLKGEKIGGIEVSDKHAAFFVNTGNGSSKDVQKLIDKVKRVTKDRFGVELKEEISYLL